MAENKIFRGQDAEFTLEVKDSTGVALDMSAALKIAVFVYYGINNNKNKILQKFSQNADPNWGVLDVSQANIGKLKFNLETPSTKGAELGLLYAEIKVIWANAQYQGSEFDLIAKDIYLATMCDSVSSNLSIP